MKHLISGLFLSLWLVGWSQVQAADQVSANKKVTDTANTAPIADIQSINPQVAEMDAASRVSELLVQGVIGKKILPEGISRYKVRCNPLQTATRSFDEDEVKQFDLIKFVDAIEQSHTSITLGEAMTAVAAAEALQSQKSPHTMDICGFLVAAGVLDEKHLVRPLELEEARALGGLFLVLLGNRH